MTSQSRREVERLNMGGARDAATEAARAPAALEDY